MVITDPPYNVAYEGNGKTIDNDNMASGKFLQFLTDSFGGMTEQMKDGASFYVWHSSREQANFEKALNAVGLEVRQQLIWNKNTFTLGRQDYQWKHEPCFYGWKGGASHSWYGGRNLTTVVDFDKPSRSDEHPTMKPVGLIAQHIENSSQQGDIVLDPFGGSGTTLIASEQTGRKCYTMELDEKYASVILARYEKLTGNKGVIYGQS